MGPSLAKKLGLKLLHLFGFLTTLWLNGEYLLNKMWLRQSGKEHLKVQWVSYIVWKFRELWSTNGLLEWLPFRVVSKYPQLIICFCHNTFVWQTDRQNYDNSPVRCITCSHTVKIGPEISPTLWYILHSASLPGIAHGKRNPTKLCQTGGGKWHWCEPNKLAQLTECKWNHQN